MYEIFEQLLQKYNISTYKVSKETRIAQSVFSSWKNGISTPKSDKMKKIADYFGVTVDYLVTGKEEGGFEKNSEIELKDKREIGYDLERVMAELEKDVDGPFYYKGKPIDDESLDLLVKALELGMARFRNNKRKKSNETDKKEIL